MFRFASSTNAFSSIVYHPMFVSAVARSDLGVSPRIKPRVIGSLDYQLINLDQVDSPSKVDGLVLHLRGSFLPSHVLRTPSIYRPRVGIAPFAWRDLGVTQLGSLGLVGPLHFSRGFEYYDLTFQTI